MGLVVLLATGLGTVIAACKGGNELGPAEQAAPWYPLLGQVYHAPGNPGLYWCMVRQARPFAPCPECVVVCTQALVDGPRFPPDGVFVAQRKDPAEMEAGGLEPALVAIEVTAAGIRVNGSLVAQDQLHEAMREARERHLRQAEILEAEPRSVARLTAAPGTRAASLNEVVTAAVGAGLEKVEFGVEVRPVPLDLRCRPSSEVDVHLFETTLFGGPRPITVLPGAENAVRWFCEEAGEGASADSIPAHTTLTDMRWVTLYDQRARSAQMAGDSAQVLLKVGAPGFAFIIAQERMAQQQSCDGDDPAFSEATHCIGGAHPEEIVAMSDRARRFFADGELARGRAEVERIVAAYDFEALRKTLEALGAERDGGGLLLLGIEGDLPAALLGQVLASIEDASSGFSHVVVSPSRF
jgi:hypothetical protein